MKITTQKAIQILNIQLSKLDKRKPDNIWQTQTSSYIKVFFGEGSPEYKHISTYHYWDDRYDYTKMGREFIATCIETIQNKGLYKKPGNFITRLDDKKFQWLIGGVCSALILLATIIYNQGRKDAKYENQELHKSSLNNDTGINKSKEQKPKNEIDTLKK